MQRMDRAGLYCMRIGMVLALAFAALAACRQPEPAQPDRDTSAPVPAADINESYLNPELNVGRLDTGFQSESREAFSARREVVAAMGLEVGDVVADVGAGTGIHVALLSDAVGPAGRVYAQDIAPKLLDYTAARADADGRTNVTTVLGDQSGSNLPRGAFDVIFHSNVYHHFEKPAEMNADLLGALKPGGELFVLDFERYRGVTPGWIYLHVRMSKETAIAEMEAAGFEFLGQVDVDVLEQNYLLRFRKPG